MLFIWFSQYVVNGIYIKVMRSTGNGQRTTGGEPGSRSAGDCCPMDVLSTLLAARPPLYTERCPLTRFPPMRPKGAIRHSAGGAAAGTCASTEITGNEPGGFRVLGPGL
jgi:hypothetical protein